MDTNVASFKLVADSASAVASDTAQIRRNGTTETTTFWGSDASWDSTVTLSAGRHRFEIVYAKASDSLLVEGDSVVRTVYFADSPTTLTLASPVALSGSSAVTGTTTIISTAGLTQTFSGTVWDVGVDTPVLVYITVRNNTGTAVVVDSACSVSGAVAGSASWSAPVAFAVDSQGANTVTISTHDSAAPFFGDTKVVVVQIVALANPATGAPVQSVVNPSDTVPAVSPTAVSGSSGESFIQVVLDSGGRANTSAAYPTFASMATETGTGATHRIKVSLSGTGETATIYLWTKVETMSILASVHADSAGAWLDTRAAPTDVASDSNLRYAFASTVISIEFADTAGNLYGNTVTTTSLADTLAYTVCWGLNETTTRWFGDAGFDTSTSSRSFGFWKADTYGAAWSLTSVPVRVLSGGATMTVCAVGITFDLPGALAGSHTSPARLSEGGACLLERRAPAAAIAPLRAWRDRIMGGLLGRLLAFLYYFT